MVVFRLLKEIRDFIQSSSCCRDQVSTLEDSCCVRKVDIRLQMFSRGPVLLEYRAFAIDIAALGLGKTKRNYFIVMAQSFLRRASVKGESPSPTVI